MIFTKILNNTIQIKKQKILIVSDDMIADMFSNKIRNSIITELKRTKHFSCFYQTILFHCYGKY